jgi:hypothetical protein
MNKSFPKDIFCYHLDESSAGSLDDDSNVASSPYCSIPKKDSRKRDSSQPMVSQQTCDFHLSPTSEERILVGPPNPYFLQFLLPKTVLAPALEETRRYPQEIKEDAKPAVGLPNPYFLKFIRPRTVLPAALEEDEMRLSAETILLPPRPLEETRRYPQEIKKATKPTMRRTRSLQLPRLSSRTRVVPLRPRMVPLRPRMELWQPQLDKPLRAETILPPALEETRYSQEIKEDAKPPMRRRSFQLPSLPSRTRVVPLRARLEMWQHQLGKPVRALSELRLNSRDHMDCFGGNVLDTVMNSPLLNDSKSADSSVSCGANRNEKEGTTGHTTTRSLWEEYQPKTTSNAFGMQDWWTFGMQDWWAFENNNAACSSPETRENDMRGVNSRSLWPPWTNFTMESCHKASGEVSGARHEDTDAKANPSTKSVYIEWDASTLITTQPTQ